MNTENNLLNAKIIFMEKLIAGKTIAVNEEGYLTNFSEWNESIANELAKEAHIELSPAH